MTRDTLTEFLRAYTYNPTTRAYHSKPTDRLSSGSTAIYGLLHRIVMGETTARLDVASFNCGWQCAVMADIADMVILNDELVWNLQ